jgi:large subunit ribosomal protein L49
MFLSFLRPLALPRAATIGRFLSTSSQTASPGTAPQPADAAKDSATAVLPYNVRRTPSSKLPIYLLAKRGGNLRQTKLRKIDGDIEKLRVQLRDALQLGEDEIIVNQLTKQIIIRVSEIV